MRKKKLKNKKAGMIDELEVNNILVQTTQSFLSYRNCIWEVAPKTILNVPNISYSNNLKRSTRKCHEQ